MKKPILPPQKKHITVSSHWINNYSSFSPEDLEYRAQTMRELGIILVGTEGYDRSYDNISLVVTETRLETDKEFEKRLKEEAKQLQQIEDAKLLKEVKEQKEYERLKKKYENK